MRRRLRRRLQAGPALPARPSAPPAARLGLGADGGSLAYAEPLLGWRLWHVGRDGRLLSWSQRATWPARDRMEARCLRLLHSRRCEAPRRGHACGIYAVRTREAAEALLRELPPLPRAVALGRVSLWGRVIENVGGWRAQFAYPYELLLLGADAAAADAVRRRYVVDVALA